MTISLHNNQLQASDLKILANWMAGDFSNQKQAFANPQLYAHIHVFFVLYLLIFLIVSVFIPSKFMTTICGLLIAKEYID